ncbi:hypothetical protein ACS0TY_005384 [Phlomoides rotata]
MVGGVGVVGCSWCNLIGRKQVSVASGLLHLNSSFLQYSTTRTRTGALPVSKKLSKKRTLVLVSANQEDNFDDVKQQIMDYFTYKAVRTVMNQLYEMNPPQYRWLYHYVASNEHGYGKTFIRNLVKDQQELGERVMVTRLHLYERWTKFCDHTKMYERISDQNLALMRERLMETVVWPSDDTNSEVAG